MEFFASGLDAGAELLEAAFARGFGTEVAADGGEEEFGMGEGGAGGDVSAVDLGSGQGVECAGFDEGEEGFAAFACKIEVFLLLARHFDGFLDGLAGAGKPFFVLGEFGLRGFKLGLELGQGRSCRGVGSGLEYDEAKLGGRMRGRRRVCILGLSWRGGGVGLWEGGGNEDSDEGAGEEGCG